MSVKVKRVRYPFSRRALAGALPSFLERWERRAASYEKPFDVYLVDLASMDGAGLRGRLILRGLKSYRIEYESLAVPDPFGTWLINQIRS